MQQYCAAVIGYVRSGVRLPIPTPATKVSAAAAKQQHQYNNNPDRFHEKPLLIGLIFLAPYHSIHRRRLANLSNQILCGCLLL
jgi:hypothetical protein